jgi:molecular chaperone Hsp33
MLGHDEVQSVLEEQGRVDVSCDFCGRAYGFDPVDAEQLFASDQQFDAGRTRH